MFVFVGFCCGKVLQINFDPIIQDYFTGTGPIILRYNHITVLAQDCSNSIANALELLQSCPMTMIRFPTCPRSNPEGHINKLHASTENQCRQTYNISGTKSQNSNVSHLVLQLSLCNLLKPGVETEDVVGVINNCITY